ncbi:MAG: hydroxyethylthiazole kinase [Clostridiales bacterium]|nr:hydroxyethylthiazole kinase [Clostridiales bacterium]
MDKNLLGTALDNVRATTPLVHCITNYVTVNDCANALLACGGSPIMADDIDDAPAITRICGGLVLNIGTLNARTIETMHAAGKVAGELGHPIVLDPVGAGASQLRTDTAAALIDGLPVTVVRGNMSEIKALTGAATATRGVDANPDDAVTEDNLAEVAAVVRELAGKLGCIVAVTGAIDLVATAERAVAVRNGRAIMGKITGTGCMLDTIIAAYAVANPDRALEATVAAIAGWGLAGEVAEGRMGALDGNASFRTYLIDAAYNMTAAQLMDGARVEEL